VLYALPEKAVTAAEAMSIAERLTLNVPKFNVYFEYAD